MQTQSITSPDIAPTKDAQEQSSLSASATEKHSESTSTNVDATLTTPFPPFAHREVLQNPFEEGLGRDNEFQEQLNERLLELVLEFHAWSTSRPEFESTSTGDALVEETQAIEKLEREQGMWSFSFESSRLRLVEFIARIKAALDVLTGVGL